MQTQTKTETAPRVKLALVGITITSRGKSTTIYTSATQRVTKR